MAGCMFMDIFNVQEGVINSLMQIYTNELREGYQYIGILYLNIFFNICESFDGGRKTVDFEGRKGVNKNGGIDIQLFIPQSVF